MWVIPLFLFLALTFAWLCWRIRRRLFRSVAGIALPLLAALLSLTAGYACWYYYRPHPAPLQQQLFHGVSYTREVRLHPRPSVIHVVEIDLDAEGIGLLVTPPCPTDGHHLKARTTGQFLAEYRVQLAINGSFFTPWHANGFWDYYPHVGDPVDVLGLAISGGEKYAEADREYVTLALTRDNKASIGATAQGAYQAISGKPLVAHGKPHPSISRRAVDAEPHPRTAIALDKTGRRLLLIVIDGRQPNYSEGMSLEELAELVLEVGGVEAVNLDGGGSSTLVIEADDGRPQVLNTPIHGRIPPGRERPVANHLGVFAKRP